MYFLVDVFLICPSAGFELIQRIFNENTAQFFFAGSEIEFLGSALGALSSMKSEYAEHNIS